MPEIIATDGITAVHELAQIERKLHDSSVEAHEVLVAPLNADEDDVDPSGARIYFDTWEPNPAFRGDILAGLCRSVTKTEHWALIRVHDPLERDDGIVQSAVTVAREQGGSDA